MFTMQMYQEAFSTAGIKTFVLGSQISVSTIFYIPQGGTQHREAVRRTELFDLFRTELHMSQHAILNKTT